MSQAAHTPKAVAEGLVAEVVDFTVKVEGRQRAAKEGEQREASKECAVDADGNQNPEGGKRSEEDGDGGVWRL